MSSLHDELRIICDRSFNEALDHLVLLARPDKVTVLQSKLAALRMVNHVTDDFHDAMQVPCGDAPYSKAFTRLTKRSPCGYDLITYRDRKQLEKLFAAHMSDIPIQDFDLDTKATERRVWIQFDKMAEASQKHANYTHPSPPTYEAIEAEIQRHRAERKQRKQRGDGSSGGVPRTMDEAQRQSIAQGIQQLQAAGDLPVVQPAGDDVFIHLRTQMSMQASGGDTYAKIAASGDAQGFASADLWSEWKLPPYSDKTSAAWVEFTACCHRVYMLGDLQRSLPPNMLKHIESHAAGLASQIDEGTVDIGSIDMAQMGQSVLGSCTETDMSQLSENIGTLLPTLNTLAASMNGVPSVDPANAAPNESNVNDGK